MKTRIVKIITIAFLSGLSLPLLSQMAQTHQQSFTPVSLLVPIMRIALESSSGSESVLYNCAAGTSAGCMVDVADNTALKNLFASYSGKAQAGTFSKISVQACGSGGSYQAKVKGTMTLNSTTYYTSSGADPLTTASGSYDYTTINLSGCKRTYLVPNGSYTVGSSAIHVSLFMALENVAWARLTGCVVPGNCTVNAGGTMSVALAYPDVVPVFGKAAPVLKTYWIRAQTEVSGNEWGQFLLLYDGSGNFLGGFTRRLYRPSSGNAQLTLDTPMHNMVHDKTNNKVSFDNYGSSSSSDDYYVRVSNMPVGTGDTAPATGATFTIKDKSGTTYSLTLIKQ